jgi:hypothetical protein
VRSSGDGLWRSQLCAHAPIELVDGAVAVLEGVHGEAKGFGGLSRARALSSFASVSHYNRIDTALTHEALASDAVPPLRRSPSLLTSG